MPRVVRLRDLRPEDAEFEEARADIIENEGLDVRLTADKALPIDEVVRWLKSRNEIAVRGPDERGLIVYRNPDTGVVAGFAAAPVARRLRLPWPRPDVLPRDA